jgi:hypothetical protein
MNPAIVTSGDRDPLSGPHTYEGSYPVMTSPEGYDPSHGIIQGL